MNSHHPPGTYLPTYMLRMCVPKVLTQSGARLSTGPTNQTCQVQLDQSIFVLPSEDLGGDMKLTNHDHARCSARRR